jgi:hypothetical protein
MDQPPVDLRLPIEITDMIIDFLFDDTNALAAMCLACKAFLPSARKHLFSTITLRTAYPCWGEPAQGRLEQPATIFTSIAHLVRRLNIVAAYGDPGGELSKWITESMPLFTALEGITTLSIQSWSWMDMEPEVGNRLIACFPHLLELSLHSNIFAESANIIDLVLQCPTVERLSLYDITTELNDSLPLGQRGARDLSNLQSLDMGGEEFLLEPIINWFHSLDAVSSLHTLRIADIANHECELVGQFVRALGPSLRHLTLMFVECMLITYHLLYQSNPLRS